MRGGRARIAQPPSEDALPGELVTLWANVTSRSEAGRHALRLAVGAGLAETLVQLAPMPTGRWVVLTLFIVLKPDYASTLSRGVDRAVGTALGVVLGVMAVALGHGGQAGLVVAAGASIAAAYAVFDVSYLLFSVFLTSFIVVVLDILGLGSLATAGARLGDTALGATLAIAGFRAWPTWEGLGAPEKFARVFRAHAEYTLALLRSLAGAHVDASRLRALQAAARATRSDAEASTMRLSEEPPRPPLTADVARALIAAVRRLAHAELALHALVVARRPDDGPDEAVASRVDALAAAIDATLRELARSLTAVSRPGPIAPLRALHAAVRAAAADAALVDITDALVDASSTLDAIVRNAFGGLASANAQRAGPTTMPSV
jgi:uncharacterized membrane protein YccC